MSEFGYLDFCPSNVSVSVESIYTVRDGRETNAVGVFIYSVIIHFIVTFAIKFYQKIMNTSKPNKPEDTNDIEICTIETVIYKPQISRSCLPIITT